MNDLETLALALEVGTLVFGIAMAGVLTAGFISLVREEFRDDKYDDKND